MTNAQVAAHFAALPPGEPAQIVELVVELDVDAGFVLELTLGVVDEDDVADIEEGEEHIGKLCVQR